MGGGRTDKSACEVLFVGDGEELEEAAGEEGAQVRGGAARCRQGRAAGLEELLEVLLEVVQGC
jgi:hypothetical protein